MAQLGEALPEAASFGDGERFEIVDELLGAGAPGIGFCIGTRRLARAGQPLPAGGGDLGNAGDEMIDLRLRPVQLDDQDRLDVEGITRMDELLDRM
mgnify:CR=1 FL=1